MFSIIFNRISIAGTDEGEIFVMDWRNYLETERGAGLLFNFRVLLLMYFKLCFFVFKLFFPPL